MLGVLCCPPVGRGGFPAGPFSVFRAAA
jgi:hypothetical protein